MEEQAQLLRQARIAGRFFFIATLCIIWTLHAGKDINWDLLNYHLYAAKNFLEQRAGIDFLPGGYPSYQNGLPYIPIYLLIKYGAPAILAASILAALHSFCLVAILQIDRSLIETGGVWGDNFIRHAVVVVLAALCPIFLIEIGTSFADITSSIPLLFGLSLLLRSERSGAAATLGAGGVLLGVAVGLKLTNVIFGAASCVIVLSGTPRAILAKLSLLFGSAMVGAILTCGSTAALLFREYGNPFFPMFNSLFLSPDFSALPQHHNRFLPHSLQEALALPLRIAVPERWIYSEVLAPDVRYGAFAILLITWLGLCAHNILRGGVARLSLRSRFGLYCGVALVLWVLTSANGRYGLPLGLLLGPAIVTILRELSASRRFGMYFLSVLIAAQSIEVAFGMTSRWNRDDWGGPWLQVQLPAAERDSARLYLSTDLQSVSFMSMFLPEGSSFANIAWDHPDIGRREWSRLRNLLKAFERRTSIMQIVKFVDEEGRPVLPFEDINLRLMALGARIDPQTCRYAESENRLDNVATVTGRRPPKQIVYIALCDVSTSLDIYEEYKSRVIGYEDLFAAAEKACPNLFSPPNGATSLYFDGVRRFYMSSDSELKINKRGELRYGNSFRGVYAVIATEKGLKDGRSFDCNVDLTPPTTFQ